jgi:L-alanine-DL-glutamate epimerase-like enolase superfamily enzyme
MQITDYRLRKLDVPMDRPIGDSQIGPLDTYEVVYLELGTDAGPTGIGFDAVNFAAAHQRPPEAVGRAFEPVGERLLGASPFERINRLDRPRGGNRGAGAFDRLVDTACWDLCGKHLDRPLYRLLGGDDPAVPAYASALAFHEDAGTVREWYRSFRDRGLDDAKVKIGFSTAEADIERLETVRDVVDGRLMIDANEAFSPKQAVRRARAYREAGFAIHWFEDPILRDDYEGLRRVSRDIRPHVNAGEYLDVDGKGHLLDAGAVDVLNVHGFSSGRAAATMARPHGVPLSVGNTPGSLGVHVAAALPECEYIEFSHTGWRSLLADPVPIEESHLVAPDRPGHGLRFETEAFEQHGHGIVAEGTA